MKTYSIAVVGTSLIVSVKDRGWCFQLRNHLQVGKSDFVKVFAYGQNGAKSDWGVSNIGGAIKLRPNAYIIEFINDGQASTTVSASVSNYTSMVSSIRAAQPAADIFFMALVRPTAAGMSVFPNLTALDTAHKNLADDLGISGFIDTRAAWGDPSLHPSEFPADDGIHPYLSGYVRAVMPTIKAALETHIA